MTGRPHQGYRDAEWETDDRDCSAGGYCIECDRIWPCPTYVWASGGRDVLATWDPEDDDKES